MLKKTLFTLMIVSMFSAALFGITGLINPETVSANALERGPRGGQNGISPGRGQTAAGTGLTPLSTAEVDGLIEAIYEEFNAKNTYLAVVEQFGAVAPFVQIANSEQSHLNALLHQADKYGVVVPELIPSSVLPTLNTLEDACTLGVAAEIADADLYDKIMAVTTHSDLIQVYSRLQSASLEAHLPQFELCQ